MALSSCTRVPESNLAPTSAASPFRAAAGAPQFAGAPPARMLLDGRPLDVDPSGAARYLVRARFEDAAGRPTDLVSGGDVTFVPSRGTAQWQTRLRFGGPAAIVSMYDGGPLTVRVHAEVGDPVPDARIATDTRAWRLPRIVAQPLGPHSVWLGWFPRFAQGAVAIARSDGAARALPLATLAAPSSGYRDDTAAPGKKYGYELSFANGKHVSLRVAVPPDPAHGSLGAFGGKGMWFSFSPSRLDDDGYDKLDPSATIARASRAGLRSIDVRTTYGPFDEVTDDAAPTIDALIDGAAAHGIAPVAWTVPRAIDFEDLRAEVAATSYRTPAGHGFAALAVDLERGDYFLGNGPAGFAALAGYLRELRAALGPRYPIVATVEDPFLGHLTNATFPYAAIAAQADALQPMTYWRMMSRRATNPRAVRAALAGSFAATRRDAQRDIPIVAGLQSTSEGPRGAPPPDEIAAALSASRALGALGATFFDWNGTPDAQWRAIGATRW